MEHNLTHWYGTTTEKILSWRGLRNAAAGTDIDQSIKSISDWWTYAPWVKKTIDQYAPETWPTPWDMISKGNFCRSAVALGQAYTIWTLYPDTKCELWLINNRSEQDVHLITVIDASKVLNYHMGSIDDVETIDYELLKVVKREDLTHIKL